MRRGAALFWLALGLWAALFAATARAGDGRRQVVAARQAYAAGENYLPEGMQAPGWYQPTPRGLEGKIGQKLAWLRELDRKATEGGKQYARQAPTGGQASREVPASKGTPGEERISAAGDDPS